MFGIVNSRSGIDAGGRLDEALRREGMSHKQAWLACGFRDGAEWSRAITGERPMDAHKVFNLPLRVLTTWLTAILGDKAEQELKEAGVDRLRMARVELPTDQRRKESA